MQDVNVTWLRKARKIASLSATEARYLVAAAGRLFISRLQFGRRSAKQIIASFTDTKNRSTPRRHSALDVPLVAWAIEVVSRNVPWRADCLIQAMAADRWLRDYGHKTSLLLGVAHGLNGLTAHAWLESEGITVAGGNLKSLESGAMKLLNVATSGLEQ